MSSRLGRHPRHQAPTGALPRFCDCGEPAAAWWAMGRPWGQREWIPTCLDPRCLELGELDALVWEWEDEEAAWAASQGIPTEYPEDWTDEPAPQLVVVVEEKRAA